MSPPEIDALVAALARSGAAGIGFEPSHAGAGLLTAPCRHHDLPLVIFGHDVRFVDVTHAVHERLVSRELGTLRRAVALQTQLRDAAREGLGPSRAGRRRSATCWAPRCCSSEATERPSRARRRAAST